MGRPTVRGKEIITYGMDELIGINLGYNYYLEFEEGTDSLVQGLWGTSFNTSLNACCKSMLQYNRCVNKATKIVKSFKNCPYANYMLPYYTLCVKRSVRIDNSSLRGRGMNCQLVDDNYVCLWLNMSEDYIKKCLDGKRVFDESVFLYMNDYQGSGYGAKVLWQDRLFGKITDEEQVFGAVWGSNGDYIMLIVPNKYSWIVDELISGIGKGYYAFIPEEGKLFHDRGGILINIEAAYRPRI